MDMHIAIAEACERRAAACAAEGGPLMAALMRGVAKDLRAGGASVALTADFTGDPLTGMVPLRLVCALHRAALDGRAPDLRPFLPSVGGAFSPERDIEAVDRAVSATLATEANVVRDYMQGPPQTNDIGRSVGLLPGFLAIAARTKLPLDIMEIGTSAGLNLCFDKFCYALGDATWGDPHSAVRLAPRVEGAMPFLDAPLSIRRRLGTDIAPIDVSRPEAVQRLVSYVWPEHPERIARLRAAARIANTLERHIDHESADVWLKRELAMPAEGACRVVFHSAMWLYMPPAMQNAARAAIEEAGARATIDAPLAWLRLEVDDVRAKRDPNTDGTDIRLILWPGGRTELLGQAQTHGLWLRPA